MNILVPGLDVLWGLFTLLQYRTQSYAEMMAYRFLVGLFESAYFPAVHYVLGSWYRGDEINRRGGVFYVGLTLGTLTAGLLQSVATRLDGLHGLAEWRWMFIINAIITIPIGLVGPFLWPGTPDKAKSFFLSKDEIDLAKTRLELAGHKHGSQITWKKIRGVFLNPMFYVLIIWNIFFWNACLNSLTGSYILWLKSLQEFSTARLNELSTTSPALGIFYVLFICFGAELFLGRAGAITLSHTWNLIGLIILIIWDVPRSAKWFAFNTAYSSVAMSSILYGWANEILKGDPDVRSFMLVAMNAIAQSTTAWTPLLVYKTVDAPQFTKGYPFTAVMSVCLIVMTWVVKYWQCHAQRDNLRR
jgi:MFS family permease